MSAIVPQPSHELVRTQALTRMKCNRIAHYELLKGWDEATIARKLGMSTAQLTLFRYRNALVLEQCQERLSKYVAERTGAGKATIRIGAAKLTQKVVERYARALDSDNEVVALRAADSLANRVDPIKHQTQLSVVELSAKTMGILARQPEEMGQLIDVDAELIKREDHEG